MLHTDESISSLAVLVVVGFYSLSPCFDLIFIFYFFYVYALKHNNRFVFSEGGKWVEEKKHVHNRRKRKKQTKTNTKTEKQEAIMK